MKRDRVSRLRTLCLHLFTETWLGISLVFKGDHFSFSPLRYEADKTRLFVDALKALAKDRIKQVTATPPVSAQPVSVNN